MPAYNAFKYRQKTNKIIQKKNCNKGDDYKIDKIYRSGTGTVWNDEKQEIVTHDKTKWKENKSKSKQRKEQIKFKHDV